MRDRTLALLPMLLAALALAGAAVAPHVFADDDDDGGPLPPPPPEQYERLLKRYVRPDPADASFWRCTYGPVFVKTDVSDRFALDAALFMERFHRAFKSIFVDPARERWRPTLVVYRTQEQYKKVIGDSSRGYYRPGPKTLYTYLDRTRGESDFATFYSKILLHEGSHQLLHVLTGRGDLPVWFNEGVATFFQEWDVTRSKKENLDRLRRTHYRFADVREAYGTERFVRLRALLAKTYEDWTPDDFGPLTNLHYAEAASFVAFLVGSKGGQRTLVRVYECLRDEGELSDVLGADRVRLLEKDWFADIARRIAEHERAEAEAEARKRDEPEPHGPGAAGPGPSSPGD